MDAIFGPENFRNEITWQRFNFHADAKRWGRVSDRILFYSNRTRYSFNRQHTPYSDGYMRSKFTHEDERGRFRLSDLNPPGGRGPIYEFYGVTRAWRYSEERMRALDGDGRIYTGSTIPQLKRYLDELEGQVVHDVWTDIPVINSQASERLGYPTQKPLSLLERIIRASSNKGDLVLDPFCGCGTAIHAAENLGRRWIGVDISAFAVGLMRERILRNFEQLTTDDVLVWGVPVNVADAEDLAERDKFEFEKWVCGAMGAEGMFHASGTRGADGGVDGVLKFYPFRMGKKPKAEWALVQVKGGGVKVNDVKALKTDVDKYGATAGVMVCFNRYMGTVENQRSRATFRDDSGTYPVIQGLSVEALIANQRPDLPLYGYWPQGGRVRNQAELLAR